MRNFEVVKKYKDKGINIPMRATLSSAGYDFEAAEDVTIPSLMIGIRQLFQYLEQRIDTASDKPLTEEQWEVINDFEEKVDNLEKTKNENSFNQLSRDEMVSLFQIIDDILDNEDISNLEALEDFKKYFKPVLVPTGIKAMMNKDEFLGLYNRSSNPLKNQLYLANGVGIIDSDYYNNEDNEGHIMFQFINLGYYPVEIKKGDRIGQGIFQKFLLIDDTEQVRENVRSGGFGSTNVDDTKGGEMHISDLNKNNYGDVEDENI